MVCEREHEPARAFRLGADERRDRVQRVEDEVRLHLRLQRGRRRGVELRQLQLRRELRAEQVERLDGRLVERRSRGRVRDDRAGRAVGQLQRHDRCGAERAGRMRRTRCGSRAARAADAPARAPRRRAGSAGRPAPWWSAPGADEREHLVGVRDRDRAEAELLEELVGEGASGRFGQAAPKLGQRRLEQFEHRRLAPGPAHAGHDPDCARDRRSPRAAAGQIRRPDRPGVEPARSPSGSTRSRPTTRVARTT